MGTVLGGIAGAAILYVVATGKAGADIGSFATNGYGEHSPGGYSLAACLVSEVVMTMMFLLIILGATDPRAPAGFAPLAIGLGAVLIAIIIAVNALVWFVRRAGEKIAG